MEDANAVLVEAGKPELSTSWRRRRHQVSGRPQRLLVFRPVSTLRAPTVLLPEANGNMIELVICNNDGMAEGAALSVRRLQHRRGGQQEHPRLWRGRY